MIKTTSNHKYGNARVGERAIKVQYYAYNATITTNLLHTVVGVDNFKVIQGLSNGLEPLIFFTMLYKLTGPIEVLLSSLATL